MLLVFFPFLLTSTRPTTPNSKLPIDEDDVALVFEDLHRGRSVIPPHAVPSRPVLIRWDPQLPLTTENCVVMEHAEAERHAKACFAKDSNTGANVTNGTDNACQTPEDFWGNEVSQVVERRAKEIARYKEHFM